MLRMGTLAAAGMVVVVSLGSSGLAATHGHHTPSQPSQSEQGTTSDDGQMPMMGDGQMPMMGDGQMPMMGDGQMPMMGDGQMPMMSPGQMPMMGQSRMAMMGHRRLQPLPQDLSVDDVQHMMGHRLEWQGNPNLKLGRVEEADDDTIIVEIVTQDNSLVQRIEIDRHTGWMRPAQ